MIGTATTTTKSSILCLALTLLLITTEQSSSVNGFTVTGVLQNQHKQKHRYSTKVFLKDDIADMIDKELIRLQNRQETQQQLNTKNQKFKEDMVILPTNYEYNDGDYGDSNSIVKRKDVKMAHDNPQRYCADRCVTTGNCDVFEDMYHLNPVQVMEFCTECVLSEEEEPCDVPDAMFGDLSP